MTSDVFMLLATGVPGSALTEGERIYTPLIGSWEVDSTWHGPDGSERTAEGEWHFGWILGGRGVQDVLFEKGAPARGYGTTIRCYDPSIDAWHIAWMAPAGGEFVALVGREVDDEIVQEGERMDGSSLERWTFSEITRESFLWRGESSRDDGTTWRLDQEMRGRRVLK